MADKTEVVDAAATRSNGTVAGDASQGKTPRAKGRRKKAEASKQKPSRAGSRKAKAPATKGRAKAKGKRGVRYSDAQRAKILSSAQREGLTGAQVQKRFGVSMITYYKWRQEAGIPARRGRRPKSGGTEVRGALEVNVRREIQRLLPQIIAEELGDARRRR